MSELLSQLQQLGDGEIDDLSIAHDASEEIVALRLRVAELVEALEEIIHPVRFMQEGLGEGERLNGMAAVQLVEDASYLRGIASAALAAHHIKDNGNE